MNPRTPKAPESGAPKTKKLYGSVDTIRISLYNKGVTNINNINNNSNSTMGVFKMSSSNGKKKSILVELSRRGAAGIASTTKGRSRVFTNKKVYNRNLKKKGGQE